MKDKKSLKEEKDFLTRSKSYVEHALDALENTSKEPKALDEAGLNRRERELLAAREKMPHAKKD